jgi:uncharacterized membrane protein
MKHTRFLSLFAVTLLSVLLFSTTIPALAQESQPVSPPAQPLLVYTQYPSLMIGFGESVTLPLKLRSSSPQTVSLEVQDLPQGWTATFRGGSQIVDAVYVDGVNEATVDLRLETPADVKAGKYAMTVLANGDSVKSELPISLTIEEKLPSRLSLTVDGLPNKRGTPTDPTTFTASLKNIQVSIQSAGQDASQLELAPNESKSLTIKATPLTRLQAGQYPFSIQASAGDVSTQLDLTVEVVGQGNLSVTAPDGRLSGQAYAGQDNPLKVVLTNDGTAPVQGIQLTSTEPSGWSVTFDQPQVAVVPPGQSVDVTARIKPPDKAVAGDYVVTINAQPLDNAAQSAQFRITVRTSTKWGVTGIGLVALAVGVVGVAVFRFGRR